MWERFIAKTLLFLSKSLGISPVKKINSTRLIAEDYYSFSLQKINNKTTCCLSLFHIFSTKIFKLFRRESMTF